MRKRRVGESRWVVVMPGARSTAYNDDECRCGEFCIASVWSTPRNPGSHARALSRVVDKCSTHQRRDDTESED